MNVAAVEQYVERLPFELATVHRLRYGLGRSQHQAARSMGITRQQFRTLEQRLRRGAASAVAGAKMS
jgi:DNA-directed RNA polymerase specialized sigma24 family protein